MKPALIVIDVQNEYFAPYGKWVIPEGEVAFAQIQTLLDTFRKWNLPVIHIRHESLDPEAAVFRPGSVGAEMIESLQVFPGEPTIVKHFPGSFTQTDLEARLRHLGADTLVVSGYMTHMCCDSTTRQADERGYTTFFAEDATATRDLKHGETVVPYQTIQQATLAIMTRFAKVLPTRQILAKIEDALSAQAAKTE
ncbi:MAG TPA: cysteine hydrolase family protein [Ktedonobacteraceae bacterium]|nr:cysteine hydrolase family protein [Ktedonobacteraceae bacterium]